MDKSTNGHTMSSPPDWMSKLQEGGAGDKAFADRVTAAYNLVWASGGGTSWDSVAQVILPPLTFWTYVAKPVALQIAGVIAEKSDLLTLLRDEKDAFDRLDRVQNQVTSVLTDINAKIAPGTVTATLSNENGNGILWTVNNPAIAPVQSGNGKRKAVKVTFAANHVTNAGLTIQYANKKDAVKAIDATYLNMVFNAKSLLENATWLADRRVQNVIEV